MWKTETRWYCRNPECTAIDITLSGVEHAPQEVRCDCGWLLAKHEVAVCTYLDFLRPESPQEARVEAKSP